MDSTQTIFDAIGKEDLNEFNTFLAQHKGSVDFFDENGMTALQHAAYKGNKDMVQLLLDRGADVNSGKHEYNYTALHFGALSGNCDVCRLLLAAGAKPTTTNSVGRTASQMAAFVGNHLTVAAINSFVPRSEISYYSVIQGQQTMPYLLPILVDPLHKFILGVNIHPVRLAINLNHSAALLDHADQVTNVLELMCKKEMTRGRDTNEIMAFKYHYLGFIVREFSNIRDKPKGNTVTDIDGKQTDILEIFAKKFLKPGKDGYSLEFMDIFLKECIREFPFVECTTFQQMIRTLVRKDSPSALSVIHCTLTGQSGFVDAIPHCSTCDEEKPDKTCSKCKMVQYCDRECQRLHWFVHKKSCNRDICKRTVQSSPKIDAAEISAELQNLIVE